MRKVLFPIWVAILAASSVLSAQTEPGGLAGQGRTAQAKPAPAAPTPANPAILAAPRAEPRTPAEGSLPVDRKRFIIGAQDILYITVWNEKDISRNYLVRPDGYISLAFAKEVKAAGETIEGLEALITDKLKDWINDPIVSVDVTTIRSTEYYMDGEWNKPGEYPLIVPTRVFEAISKAGGLREWSNPKDIKIVRGQKVFKFNYKEVSQGKKLDQNILLEPGDHIVVK